MLLLCVWLICANALADTLLVSSTDWQPYTGHELQGGGIINQLVTEAFARSEIQVEYEYVPWARALFRASHGQVDAVTPTYISAERQQMLAFSEPLYQVEARFITLDDSPLPFDGSFASLAPYTIAVLRDSVPAQQLKQAGIRVVEVSEQEQNVGLLLKRRVDALLLPSEVFFFQQQHARGVHFPQLRVVSPAYSSLDLHLAVSRYHPQYQALITAFNRGLAEMKADGSYQRLLQQAGMPPTTPPVELN